MKADRHCVRRKRLQEGGKSTLNHCCKVKELNKQNTGMGIMKRYRQRRVGMSGLVWKKYL